MTSRWNDTDKKGEFKYYLTPGYEGQATISVFSQNGSVENHEFYIPYDEDVYVEIKIGTGSVVPDQPDIIANCGNGKVYYLNAARPTASTFGGVIVEDSWMTVVSDFNALEESYNYFVLQIPDYSPAKREYNNFCLAAIDNDKIVQCFEGTLTVTQEGEQYYYSLSGKGYYGNMDSDGDVSNIMSADITVNNVGISHLMTLERHENYYPTDPFQSFVPHLSTPAPVAMVITKSQKLGTGGFLYYNGDFSDFDLLNDQAEKTDYARSYYNKETDYAEALYVTGNSVIMIDADLDTPSISSSSWKNIPMFDFIGVSEEEGDPYESQVSVIMWNGGTLSLDFILSDYSTRSPQAIHKVKNILGKRLNR